MRVAVLACCAALALAAEAQASFDRYSYTNEFGTRTYWVYVPPGHNGSSLPLVVDLPGCGSDAAEESRWSGFKQLAARRPFLVAYPEQDPDANGGRCWNWFHPDHQTRDAGETTIIAGITRTVIKRWNADPRRVYVGGISAGGAMANNMAVTYPDLYAAVMVYAGCEYRGVCLASAGPLPGEVSGQLAYQAMGRHARVVPMITIQGDTDVLVPFPNAELVVQQYLASDDWADDGEHNGSVSTTRARTASGAKPGGHAYDIDSYEDSRGCLIAERWLIHGMGHAWSGATSEGGYRDELFTDPKGPDVTTPIYEFFMDHPMPLGRSCATR